MFAGNLSLEDMRCPICGSGLADYYYDGTAKKKLKQGYLRCKGPVCGFIVSGNIHSHGDYKAAVLISVEEAGGSHV